MADVLVVDDSSAVRNAVAGFLVENQIDVVTAVNGLDGIAKLKKDSKIKLIITDIMMPEMDGMTMLDKIRHEMGNQEVKILILTNENTPEFKQKCKPLKVRAWIVKPFDGPSALSVVKRLIGD
ncbi:response regulator [Deltaproteobacteria bacterium TL4]